MSDRWLLTPDASDVDMYDRLNPQNPGHEFCRHLVDLDEATCWRCQEERTERAAALAGRSLVAMLDRIEGGVR